MLLHHPQGWINQWFDVGNVRYVRALSELCPCVKIRERRALTFDQSIANLVQRSPFVNATTLLVCGYFQSWKYASAVEDELRRRLRWKSKITNAIYR